MESSPNATKASVQGCIGGSEPAVNDALGFVFVVEIVVDQNFVDGCHP
jgi:hypothetical protein